MPEEQKIEIPKGLVTVTTYGMIQGQTAQCLLDARSFSEQNGLTNVLWRMIPGSLVEKARNEAVRQMLREQAGWLLFIDGDMVFQPDSILRILQTAYAELPNADVLGAYCTLRGELALPTADSGTGTWESWFPNSGVVSVMRTGGAFLLIKRHVLEALRDPWFRMRVPARPIDFMAEVDNYARIKFDGFNPFRGHAEQYWERLEKCAIDDPSIVVDNYVPVEVGEDSGFCDRTKLAGFNIFVDTRIVIAHIDQKVTSWQDHKRAIDESLRVQRLACGLLA
jgi:hypothetical protein